MDRVRELGDASVPFRFDVHALIFSNDAVGLENELHAQLTERRVNRVNLHREFFRARPAEVRDLLTIIAGNHMLEFTETAEALEWRASGAVTTVTPLAPEQDDLLVPPPAEDSLDALTAASPPVEPPAATAAVRQLSAGQILPLNSTYRVRLLTTLDGNPDNGEIDPIAVLLTSKGEVSSDDDVIFFGQPDHPTGVASLAADESGSAHALHFEIRSA